MPEHWHHSEHTRNMAVRCERFVETNGNCDVAGCPYNHMKDTLELPVPRDICKFFRGGACLRERCQFFHGTKEQLTALAATGATTYRPAAFMATRHPLSELTDAERRAQHSVRQEQERQLHSAPPVVLPSPPGMSGTSGFNSSGSMSLSMPPPMPLHTGYHQVMPNGEVQAVMLQHPQPPQPPQQPQPPVHHSYMHLPPPPPPPPPQQFQPLPLPPQQPQGQHTPPGPLTPPQLGSVPPQPFVIPSQPMTSPLSSPFLGHISGQVAGSPPQSAPPSLPLPQVYMYTHGAQGFNSSVSSAHSQPLPLPQPLQCPSNVASRYASQ